MPRKQICVLKPVILEMFSRDLKGREDMPLELGERYGWTGQK
jgi:hypothetical protein